MPVYLVETCRRPWPALDLASTPSIPSTAALVLRWSPRQWSLGQAVRERWQPVPLRTGRPARPEEGAPRTRVHRRGQIAAGLHRFKTLEAMSGGW